MTFVASKFAVISFLYDLELFGQHNSEFEGKSKQIPVIPCTLIVYSLRFWKDNVNWISCIYNNNTVYLRLWYFYYVSNIVCFSAQVILQLIQVKHTYNKKTGNKEVCFHTDHLNNIQMRY